MKSFERLRLARSPEELEENLSQLGDENWKATAVCFLRYDSETQTLRTGSRSLSPDSKTQVGLCALSIEKVSDQSLPWPDDLTDSPAVYREAFPVFSWGSLVGVLALGFPAPPSDSVYDDIAAVTEGLGTLDGQLAQIQRLELYVQRSGELLMRAVEVQSGRVDHVGKVSRLSSALAMMLDCSAQVQAELLQAAQYHDIGTLGFEDMGSPEALREHPRIGASLLACHPDMSSVADLVANHHERYDGSGYPLGLKGDELPLETWILVLTEDLVESWEQSIEAFDIKLKLFFNDRAKHHHPDVVDALCGLVDSGKFEALIR